MIDVPPPLLALAAGVALGAVFFGGLWWTVARAIVSRSAALWFFVSLLLRTSITMAGFCLVARGSWERLALCLLGFVMVRFLVTRLSADAAARPRSAGKASHAP